MNYFYKSASGLFYVENSIVSPGNYSLKTYNNNTIVILEIETGKPIFGPIEVINILKENNTPYTNLSELLTTIKDFFGSIELPIALELFNFKIDNINKNRVNFESNTILTGITFGGITISYPTKTIITLNINLGQLTGHYFTMDSEFDILDQPTIDYSGTGSDISNETGTLQLFTLTPIENNIGSQIFFDTFTDTDGVLVQNHTPEVGNAGFSYSGSHDIDTNRLTITGGSGVVLWDVGNSDIIYKINTESVGSFYVRWGSALNADNRLRITIDLILDRIRVEEIIGGASVEIGNEPTDFPINKYLIHIACFGSSVKIYNNFELVVTATTNLLTGNYVGGFTAGATFIIDQEVKI